MEDDRINPDLLRRLWDKKGRPGTLRIKKFGVQLELKETIYGTFVIKANHPIFVSACDLMRMVDHKF